MITCSVVLFSYIVFFFFKQKTAYEMRISDWSSDVCSSDLLAIEPQRLLTERPIEGAGAIDRGGAGDGASHHFDQCDRIRRVDRMPHQQQIGRASCRERVCQYV